MRKQGSRKKMKMELQIRKEKMQYRKMLQDKNLMMTGSS